MILAILRKLLRYWPRRIREVYYFIGGYDEYVRQKGEDFVPEVGVVVRNSS